MLQITHPSLTLQPDRKILKADEYQAYLDAQQIIQAAEQEAERIRAAAQQEYDAEKRRGYEEGVEEGQAAAAESMFDSLSKTVDFIGGLESKVAEIVIQAIEKVIGQMNEKDLVVGAARNALDIVRNEAKVTLRVCPDQVAAVRQRAGEILSGHPAVSFLDVQPDDRLQPGGCVLESEIGVVDASIDLQMEAMKKSIRKAVQHDS